MKSVRHVSMVERDVALRLRVTDSPKKLKPLQHGRLANSSYIVSDENLPDADHDEDA